MYLDVILHISPTVGMALTSSLLDVCVCSLDCHNTSGWLILVLRTCGVLRVGSARQRLITLSGTY